MKNYTTPELPRAHHVDHERKIVTVFLPDGKGAVKLVQSVSRAYPKYLVQFTPNFNTLEQLHGDD